MRNYYRFFLSTILQSERKFDNDWTINHEKKVVLLSTYT